MLSRKRVLIYVIVIIQLLVIGLLYKELQQSILGESKVVIPQNKDDYISTDSLGPLHLFYEPKPNSGRTDQVINSSETVSYKINSQSLNEDKEYQPIKDSSVFRIISLGDSFTFGLYVNPVDNYSKKLEKLLNQNPVCPKWQRYEVINLGVPGYDIQYAIKRFELKGKQLNPDLVIWLIKHDDVFLINEFIKERSEEIRDHMIRSGEQKELEEKGLFYEYITRARQELIDKVGIEEILNIQSRKITNIGQHYKGRLLLFNVPSGRDSIEAMISNFTSRRESTYYFGDLPEYPGDDYIFPDKHPNEKGHEFLAQNLYSYMKQNQVINCD